MKKGFLILIICVVILVLGVVIFLPKYRAIAPVPGNEHSAVISDYKNASYEVDGQTITLKDGEYSEKVPDSSSEITTTYFGNEAKGDLNGDGKDDVAFILVQNGGGSGDFYFLVTALETDNRYKGLNAMFLGDRIAPQNTEIKDGVIIANYADRLPNEPMAAEPSVGISKYFKVVNERLTEIQGEMGDVGATTSEQVACTMEAKQCPDGSYVGRQGPKCEFSKCPGEK